MMQRTAVGSIIGLLGLACVLYGRQKTEAAPKPGATEYCQAAVGSYEDSVGSDRVMNLFGKEGWEVFSVQEAGSADTFHRVFFMKRALGYDGKSCKAINDERAETRQSSRPKH
jgi:hypothetical protein